MGWGRLGDGERPDGLYNAVGVGDHRANAGQGTEVLEMVQGREAGTFRVRGRLKGARMPHFPSAATRHSVP